MGIMMVPVPHIPAYVLFKAGKAAFRVPEFPFQVPAIQPFQEIYELLVHGPEVIQGQVYRAGLRIKQGGPGLFVIDLYQRSGFGQSPFETHIAVVMAVCQMMYHLPYGPSSGAVRGVKLPRVQGLYEIRKLIRKTLKVRYPIMK
jgi:hypothetical protein